LYSIEQNQIWRLERDGASKRQVTFETRPVLAFDVRPADNGLVYIIGDPSLPGSDRVLVALDASGRTELVRGPIGAPLVRPGGDEIVFRLYEPVDGLVIGGDGRGLPGIWGTTRRGGRPFSVQPDDPPPSSNASVDPARPETFANEYDPITWAPDGSRLLMSAYPGFGEAAPPKLKVMADGSVVDLPDACCGEATWGNDGQIYFAGGVGVQDARLGLWRLDPTTLQVTELISGSIDDKYVLVTGAYPAGQGGALVFMTLAAEAPEVNPAALTPLTMTRVTSDGTRTALRPNDGFNIVTVRWAPGGEGAAVHAAGQPGQPGTVYWLPSDGGPARALPLSGLTLAWGSDTAQPASQACDLFTPIGWEAPGARKERAEVADVQRRLLALGYTQLGAADGLYGDRTREAVRAFQADRGLAATGEVDCATWQTLGQF
jgi:hypothetical protein